MKEDFVKNNNTNSSVRIVDDTRSIAEESKKYSDALKSAQSLKAYNKRVKGITNSSVKLARANRDIQVAVNKIYSPAIKNACKAASSFSKYQDAIKPAVESANRALENIKPVIESQVAIAQSLNGIKDVLNRVVSSYKFDFTPLFNSPVFQFLKEIRMDYLESLRNFLDESRITGSYFRKRINDIVFQEVYDAKWFPYAEWGNDYEIVSSILDILDSTRKSKNRVKKIDKLIFRYYTKSKIEELRKGWKNLGIPKHIVRMMQQGVQAYHRKEYAVTLTMLSTLWEEIIYDKLNDAHRKNGKRTKNNFEKLVDANDYNKLITSFFEDFIMYDCESVEDVKDDVPGRNSTAHGWYSKYPSRKAALNAILFTDFLLKMGHIEQDEEEF